MRVLLGIIFVVGIYIKDFQSDFKADDVQKIAVLFGVGSVAIIMLGILLSIIFGS